MSLFQSKIRWPELILILFSIISAVYFVLYYFFTGNYEFVLSITILLIFMLSLILTSDKTKFSNGLLFLLSLNGFLHILGGSKIITQGKLYDLEIFHIIGSGESFILKFDQVMHFFGMFIVVMAAYHLISVYLGKKEKRAFIGIIAFLVGVGWGAMIELLEFFYVITIPQTGVGGYFNTILDLLFNLLGALFGAIFCSLRKNKYLI